MSAAVEGAQVDFDNASKIETQYFVSLACGQVSKNMIKAFFYDLQGINKGSGRPEGYDKYTRAKKVVVPWCRHDGRRYRLPMCPQRHGGRAKGHVAGGGGEGQGLQPMLLDKGVPRSHDRGRAGRGARRITPDRQCRGGQGC